MADEHDLVSLWSSSFMRGEVDEDNEFKMAALEADQVRWLAEYVLRALGDRDAWLASIGMRQIQPHVDLLAAVLRALCSDD